MSAGRGEKGEKRDGWSLVNVRDGELAGKEDLEIDEPGEPTRGNSGLEEPKLGESKVTGGLKEEPGRENEPEDTTEGAGEPD